MKLGIVGLPNVGKSTLFNSLTKAGAESANYPFCTIDPNVGVVTVPDERLNVLGEMYHTKKIIPAAIEFVDIAGLVKGASKGEGLGNQFLANIREVDAIVHVVRCFENTNIVHVDGSIDPLRDIETINLELIFSDLEVLERRIVKTVKLSRNDKTAAKELDLLQRLKAHLEDNKMAKSFTTDDEDEQAEEYKKNFGAGRVIIFDKQAAYDRADTMDNFNDHRAIIYARNECWRIAEELGLKYFLMLDDDYKSIDYRYEEDGKLKYKPSHDFDRVFEDMIQFLEVSGADTVAFCQGGDFVGGVDGGNFHKGLLRKAMNSFFCKTDTQIEYRGTMNEDVVTYTTLSSRGHLFFSNTQYCVVQLPTQSLSGGMTDAYKEGGTYLKTFYAIMSMPSAVKVSMMYTTHKRIHHRINWEHTAPKILNEKWRKERKEDT